MCPTQATPGPASLVQHGMAASDRSVRKGEAMELVGWQKLKNHPDPIQTLRNHWRR
jgi:hypothetical protein